MISRRPAHRPSARDHILNCALELARAGSSMSLESAAQAAGVTKAGLMYHFPTKADLMTAVVDHLMDVSEAQLLKHLQATAGTPHEGADDATVGTSSVRERLVAYIDWACSSDVDAGDLVMFTDPRLREPLTARWAERIEPWVTIPTDLPDAERARLLTARLAGDGIWFSTASGATPLTGQDREAVQTYLHHLITETS